MQWQAVLDRGDLKLEVLITCYEKHIRSSRLRPMGRAWNQRIHQVVGRLAVAEGLAEKEKV